MIVGIICEYNPFHLGHRKQIVRIREDFGADTGVVCAMSGNFVQRGHPAIFDKMRRAEAAVRCGADLVLELPAPVCLSSAEGFASGGVSILSRLCDGLCFGAETADAEALSAASQALLSEDFSPLLREQLASGKSFPAARQAALTAMGLPGSLLETPNNILAVEYCKAILAQGSPMKPLPIRREGSYHAQTPDAANPSASSLRLQLEQGADISPYLPQAAVRCFENAPIHTLQAGERAVLYRLRTMTEAEFAALPFGNEGLWRKLMHAARQEAGLEAVAAAVKSKRYTRTRIDRMILCACLGVTQTQMEAEAPYVRVLAFNDRGRKILKAVKKQGFFRNAGEPVDHPFQDLERRWENLYPLFRVDAPGVPGGNLRERLFYPPKFTNP